jgi:DNA-binding XRE family transcriptional regulator
MSGFVYIVESSNGLFKIGFTNDPPRRLSMLRTSTADRLTLLGTIPATVDDEQELHELLDRWNVAREWFKPCRAIAYLIEHSTPYQLQKRRYGTEHPLAVARLEAHLTQQDLADLIGKTRYSVLRIENWKTSPSARDIAKLIGVFKERDIELSADDFLASEAA